MEKDKTMLQEFKDSTKMEGELLVLSSFPEKIMRLNRLLNMPEWKYANLKDVHETLNIPVPEPVFLDGLEKNGPKRLKLNHTDVPAEVPGTKVYAFANGIVPCNSKIVKLVDAIKPIIMELMDDSNLLKMWLSFMIPKIEDGNNFGVSVQEDTLAEIQSVESEAAQYLEQISRYFTMRGKMVTKVAKYPHIQDYRKTVDEIDEKEYFSLRIILREVQNRYAVLHDIVTKNIEKLKQPRNSNSESLY